jgi:hypothetical protein
MWIPINKSCFFLHKWATINTYETLVVVTQFCLPRLISPPSHLLPSLTMVTYCQFD